MGDCDWIDRLLQEEEWQRLYHSDPMVHSVLRLARVNGMSEADAMRMLALEQSKCKEEAIKVATDALSKEVPRYIVLKGGEHG